LAPAAAPNVRVQGRLPTGKHARSSSNASSHEIPRGTDLVVLAAPIVSSARHTRNGRDSSARDRVGCIDPISINWRPSRRVVGGAVVLSVLYVARQRALQMFFLRLRSTASKDLEVVVLRYGVALRARPPLPLQHLT